MQQPTGEREREREEERERERRRKKEKERERGGGRDKVRGKKDKINKIINSRWESTIVPFRAYIRSRSYYYIEFQAVSYFNKFLYIQ